MKFSDPNRSDAGDIAIWATILVVAMLFGALFLYVAFPSQHILQ